MGCDGAAWLTMVCTTGLRGISAPMPGEFLPPPSALTFKSAELFLSHVLVPLFGCSFCPIFYPIFFPFLNMLSQRCYHHCYGLSLGQKWFHLWSWMSFALSHMGEPSNNSQKPKPCHTNLTEQCKRYDSATV